MELTYSQVQRKSKAVAYSLSVSDYPYPYLGMELAMRNAAGKTHRNADSLTKLRPCPRRCTPIPGCMILRAT